MHVCMYVYMYVRMYVCMHVCLYVSTYICTYICTYVRMQCTYVCMYDEDDTGDDEDTWILKSVAMIPHAMLHTPAQAWRITAPEERVALVE